MATLHLDHVDKVYPGGTVASADVDLEIADGEFMVLVGPSGCGKSTLLRVIAGLEAPTRGRVWIGERDVTDLPPQKRDVAMVFQSYALYPHKTVRENLGLALRLRRVPREEIDRRIGDVARTLELTPVLDRRPAQLSGGQRQRVALGRAIVREPVAFLFDEPLSNLDAQLRARARAELARLHRRLGVTTVYVTHDQQEAMTLGDRVAVLHEGRLRQCAAPLELYHRPASTFVASFVGSPPMSFFEGRLRARQGRLGVEGPAFFVTLAPAAPAAPLRVDTEVKVGVRPEDVELVGADAADVRAIAEVVEPLGHETLVHLTIEGLPPGEGLRALVATDGAPRVGDPLGVRLRQDRIHLFDPRSGLRL